MLKKLDEFGDNYLTLNRTKKRDAVFFRISKYADHSKIWFAFALIRFAFLLDWKDLFRFLVVMALESGITNGPIKFIFRK